MITPAVMSGILHLFNLSLNVQLNIVLTGSTVGSHFGIRGSQDATGGWNINMGTNLLDPMLLLQTLPTDPNKEFTIEIEWCNPATGFEVVDVYARS